MPNGETENQGCLGFILPFINRFSPKTEDRMEELPYRVRDDFLSPAEFSFYKVLLSIVGNHVCIQSKVRLADIFFVSQPDRNFSYFAKISQRHVDFLGCDPVTMKPLFGIELDDASHNRQKRKESDHFLDEVFKTANLPLLRIPAQKAYNTEEIGIMIKQFLRAAIVLHPPEQQSSIQAKAIPICPKCGIPMVLRTVTKGEHTGKQFYGCKNYPRCRQVKPVP